jgi:hypothetical protein
MHVDYAFIAEAADSQGGLFYVTRGGTDIYAMPKDFPKPLNLGALSFVVRLAGDPEDVGETRSVRFVIVDADGHPLAFDQTGEARFERHPIDPTLTSANMMAFRFYGFPVPDFGAYLFEVHSGDERLASVRFWVVPAESMSQPGDGTSNPGGGYL